jgi:predicted transcriptional regulator
MSRLAETKVYLPWEVLRAIDQLAARNRCSRSEVIRASVHTFVSPDGTEQLEAALGRRLDRITRALERLERDLSICLEAEGLFIRAWLTATPALPNEAREAAEAKGRERYGGFVEALGRRIAAGRSLAVEVLQDHPSRERPARKEPDDEIEGRAT